MKSLSSPLLVIVTLASMRFCMGADPPPALYIKTNANAWVQTEAIPDPRPGVDFQHYLLEQLGVDFDYIMRNYAESNMQVFIGPGEFDTKGVWDGSLERATNQPGFRIPTGCGMTGYTVPNCTPSGQAPFGLTNLPQPCNQTTLKLTDVRSGAIENVVLMTSLTSSNPLANIGITNLNIDCNGGTLTTNKGEPLRIMAVWLVGVGDIHVVGVNAYGATQPDIVENDNTDESFVIQVDTQTGLLSSSNLIKNCSVRGFHNPTGWGKCSGINLNQRQSDTNWITGTVEGCYVELGGHGGEFSYNGARMYGCVFKNNTSKSAARGFNNDSQPNLCVSFKDNVFEVPSGSYGFYLPYSTAWSRFTGNRFTAYGNPASSGIFATGPCICEGTDYLGSEELLIDANHFFKGDTQETLALDLYGNNGTNVWTLPSNVALENNNVQDGLNNHAPSGLGYMCQNWYTDSSGYRQGLLDDIEGFPANHPNWGWRFTSVRQDFDQSGTLDFLLQDSSSNLKTWLMDGLTPTEGTIHPNLPDFPGWSVVAAADIDRDGRSDVFLQHTSRQLGYWTLDRAGPDSHEAVLLESGCLTNADYNTSLYIPSGWSIAGSADFDGNGHADLLLQSDAGEVGIWYMSEHTRTNATLTTPYAAYPWRAIASGDFDSDGKADILFQERSTDPVWRSSLAVWLMDNACRKTNYFVNPQKPPSTNWLAVAAGDFINSDGTNQTDIAFQDLGDNGKLKIWAMAGISAKATNNIVNQTMPTGYSVIGPR
jgi:hypothetical protein